MNIVIEKMQPRVLRTYLTILQEQNPEWEKQPESFEAKEITKVGVAYVNSITVHSTS